MFDTFKTVNTYISRNGFPLAKYSIPKKSEGNFEITHVLHKAGEELEVISMRMAIMAGQRPTKIRLEKPWREIKLVEKGQGVWMSTHPIETYTHIYPYTQAHHKVLVGGLGLGYVVHGMLANTRIREITVIEKEASVIDLVWPSIEKEMAKRAKKIKLSVIEGDIFKHLEAKSTPVYDFIYLDTWRGTGESEFIDTVVPLRRLAKTKLVNSFDIDNRRKNIICWMEEIMRGQFITGFATKQMFGIRKTMESIATVKDGYGRKFFEPFIAFVTKYGVDVLDKMPQEEYYASVVEFMNDYEV